jgi:hypothetical protein
VTTFSPTINSCAIFGLRQAAMKSPMVTLTLSDHYTLLVPSMGTLFREYNGESRGVDTEQERLEYSAPYAAARRDYSVSWRTTINPS